MSAQQPDVFSNLAVEKRNCVLHVRIDRADKRNALSRAVLADLADVFAAHASDATLKAAVLTGAGDKAFAAGGDLREFARIRDERGAQELFDGANRALESVRRFPVPVIAALNGLAVGGGAELAVACDFRVAASHAAIGFVQARLNISSGFGGGTDLVRLLGPARALLCGLRAEILPAPKAKALGLLDEVAEAGESLDDCVARFLEPWLRQAPQVIRSYKAMALAERLGLPVDARRQAERAGFVATWVHPDHWAAADRALEKDREATK
jgi:enoyl-CoA hydratase